MALTADIKLVRYGVVDAHPPLQRTLTAAATVYRGSVALTRSGYLVAASSPQSTDQVVGMIECAGNGVADTGSGILGASPSGTTPVQVATGTFLLSAGTGADALTVANDGATVYLIDEQTVGATNGSSTRPVAGVLVATPTDDASIPTGKVAVAVGTPPTFGAL